MPVGEVALNGARTPHLQTSLQSRSIAFVTLCRRRSELSDVVLSASGGFNHCVYSLSSAFAVSHVQQCCAVVVLLFVRSFAAAGGRSVGRWPIHSAGQFSLIRYTCSRACRGPIQENGSTRSSDCLYSEML